MKRASLLRYNLRVVVFNHWWILVFPVAVSQLAVFWNLITQRFSPSIPTMFGEMVTPLLAAFLSAHVLSAEYPSRVGAILASKPLNIGKIVLLRLLAVLSLVWLLEIISLLAFRYGMESYDMTLVFLASVPSTLFMAMLALTFATLLRHPLMGFGISALYWAMDLPTGLGMNPFASLRTLATLQSALSANPDALLRNWWVAKLVLLAGAFVLYLIHARLVFRLGVAPTLKGRRRALAAAAAILAGYLAVGTVAKVSYGYLHRGDLDPNDGTWFRREFAPYGPIPVTYVFGPAFRRYIGEIPNAWRVQPEGDSDLLGDSPKHRRELKEVVDNMAGSVWAPSAAEMLARLTGRKEPDTDRRVAVYQALADRYPNSPYVDFSIREKAITLDSVNRFNDAEAIYKTLLESRPKTRFRSEALRYIVENDRKSGRLGEAEKWTNEWLRVAPVNERPPAFATLAEIAESRGDKAAAKEQARNAIQAVKEFRRQLNSGELPNAEKKEVKWDRDVRSAEARANTVLSRH